MAGVIGVGGVFIKAPDIEAWRDWYRRVLGVRFEDFGLAMFKQPTAGHTMIAPFAADTDYFTPSPHPVMMNLIVDDLEGVLATAKAAGAEPLGRHDDEYGHFAWLIDPAGVKVELWEPPGRSPT